jgi:hypothetical protein
MARRFQRLPLTGGANPLEDPKALRDDEYVSGKNLVPTKVGRLVKRRGMGWQRDVWRDGGGFPRMWLYPLNWMFTPWPSRQELLMVVIYTDEVPNNPNWNVVARGDYTGTDSVGLTIFDPMLTHRPAMVHFGDAVYVLPGYPYTVQAIRIQKGDPDNVIDNWRLGDGASDESNQFPARVGCSYRNRFVLANFGPGYENAFAMSDRDNASGFGPAVRSTRSFRCGPNDGDGIVAATEVLQSEATALESSLLVLKEHSAFIWTGEPGTSDKTATDQIWPATWVGNPVPFSCGCSSAETLVRTPYGLIWAGPDDVWVMAYGQLPRRIGTKLRPKLKNTPATDRWQWHAAYHDGFYRLSIFSEGANKGLYQACDEEWWLDLRGGLPQGPGDARWFGPQVPKVIAMNTSLALTRNPASRVRRLDTRAGKTQALYSLEHSLQANSDRPALVLVAHDVSTGADYANKYDGSGLRMEVNDGTEIQTELVTKRYDFGAPELEKIYDGLDISVKTSLPMQMQVEAHIDGGASVDTANKTFPQTGFIGGVDTTDGDRMTEQYQTLPIDPDPASRLVGQDIQLTIRDRLGYVIDDNMTTLAFTVGGTSYAATLTAGYYADIDALLDHVVSRMAAAQGGAWSHNQSNLTTRNTYVGITGPAAWIPLWLTGGESTARIGAMLGYDTSANPAAFVTQYAEHPAAAYPSSEVEYGGLRLRYNDIPREP